MLKAIVSTVCAGAGVYIAAAFTLALIGGTIGAIWMCIERGEWPWQVFGKSGN